MRRFRPQNRGKLRNDNRLRIRPRMGENRGSGRTGQEKMTDAPRQLDSQGDAHPRLLAAPAGYRSGGWHGSWYSGPRANGQREVFSIKVLRRLTGDEKGEFKALPFSSFLPGKERFYGDGKTADAALRACLAKIKGVPYHEIFSSSEEE